MNDYSGFLDHHPNNNVEDLYPHDGGMEGYMDDQIMDEEQDDNREEWMEEEEEDNYSDMSAYGDEPAKKGSDLRASGTAPPLTASQGGEVKLVMKPLMQGNPMAVKCYCADTTPSPALSSAVDLRCAACGGFFHQRCLKNPALIRPRPLPGDWGYKFICANCSDKKSEEFTLIGKGWADIAHVTLYNLKLHAIERGQPERVFFRFKEEICNFIDQNWESLCHEKTRTITWNNTVGGSLSTHSHTFQNGADTMASAGWWGLRSYENPFLLKLLDPTLNSSTKKKKGPATKKQNTLTQSGNKRGRPKREIAVGDREFVPEGTNLAERRRKPRQAPAQPVMVSKSYYQPLATKYTQLCVAKENSAPQMIISPDMLTVRNEKGYCMARASFGVSPPAELYAAGVIPAPSVPTGWYYEVIIKEGDRSSITLMDNSKRTLPPPAWRLGWSSEKGDLQAPVGYDKHSYSYRNSDGAVMHKSRSRQYGEGFQKDDVIGFFILLTDTNESIMEEEEVPPPPTSVSAVGKKKIVSVDLNTNSQIQFFKNGVSQGVAFESIYKATYYPAVSLFYNAAVTFNFGPEFKYPPKNLNVPYKPCSDLLELHAAIVKKKEEEEAKRRAEMEAAAAADAANNPIEAVTEVTDTHMPLEPLLPQ